MTSDKILIRFGDLVPAEKLILMKQNFAQPSEPVMRCTLRRSDIRTETWLLSDVDPGNPYFARALHDDGLGRVKLCHVHLDDLSYKRGYRDELVMHDEKFDGMGFPLEVWEDAAQEDNRISYDRRQLETAARVMNVALKVTQLKM